MKKRCLLLVVGAIVGIVNSGAIAADIDNWLIRKTSPQRETVRYEVNGDAHTRFEDSAAAHPFTLRTICVREGERLATRTIRWDNNEPKLAWCSFIDKWYVAYEMPPAGENATRCVFAANGSDRVGDTLPTGLAVFEGYLPSETVSIREVARTAGKRELTPESVDDHACIKLTIEHSIYGHYVLWLDPNADYSIRKLMVKKLAANVWHGEKLNAWDHDSPLGSTGKIHPTAMTLVVDNVTLDQQSGRWQAAAWRSTLTQEYSDGNALRAVYHGERLNVPVGEPAPDLALTPQIREGTVMTNLTDSQLPYEWSSRGPKPWVDRKLVASMDGAAIALRDALKFPGNQR